ncbi:MAG: type II secretion system F family protein [Nitrospirae bacterium]|nr:type II secretion system F family protein [Nitrospirota bacterium]
MKNSKLIVDMPIFKYTGYKENGLEIEGVLEADSQKDAAFKVKASGVYLREIIRAELFKKKPFAIKRLPQILPAVTRNLATLLSSGVSVTEAIGAMASEQKSQWKDILIDLKERLSAGASLARAMQAHPAIFPEFYISMVNAGENSGRLAEVLSKLADFLEAQESIKGKLRNSLVYPIFMACVSILILSFLFSFVIPKITKIFEDTSSALPFITIILIWISKAFHKLWWLMAILVISAGILYKRLKETKREAIDSILLRMPGGILQSLYMSRFALTMSFLISGGLPILQAMQLSAKAAGNAVLENKIMAARSMVSQGAKLSISLEGFPPTFLQIISTGEQSGQLAEVLKRAAVSYEAEFDRKLQKTVSLLEPSLILFMGLIVGFIVLAVLLPIFELNQLIK